MTQEMESMRRYDEIFANFAEKMKVNGSYNPKEINFECLRNSIDTYEEKCGKFSDYGLDKIKYIAHACEKHTFLALS